jgi:hypothetical protein
MHMYTTCATCGKELWVSPAMRSGYMTHYECPDVIDPVSLLRRQYIQAVERDADEGEIRRLADQLDAVDDQPPPLEAAALLYAAWSWPVFPCRPGHKRPATEHGLKDASTDPGQIEDWWRRWPAANIGVATGHLFDVVDIDPPGLSWWRDMVLRHDMGQESVLPDIHGTVSTPRAGGMHLYIEPSGKGNLAGFAPGVDYRGVGGYVLLPPSVLSPAAYPKDVPSARHLTYTWTVYPSPTIKKAVA